MTYEQKMWLRFWAKVEKTDTCWNWIAAKNPDGYGRFGIGRKLVYPHRLIVESERGVIPAGMVVDHLCRNPSCVRPDHLEVVTMRENSDRGEHPSYVTRKRGTCKRGHSSAEHGYYRPGTTKLAACRQCQREKRAAKKISSKWPHDPSLTADQAWALDGSIVEFTVAADEVA